ncbi:hypothetical protein Acr_27g0004690 [Actinidia rufa]|uniref:Uncharacterized protein n=1 Tax=Actinidia rufa TaxID=165716 RepID=A0A7J0H6K5_9ERIC|nr:hypothetical protein Acr_27g0004690 [Actinidia rufa]
MPPLSKNLTGDLQRVKNSISKDTKAHLSKNLHKHTHTLSSHKCMCARGINVGILGGGLPSLRISLQEPKVSLKSQGSFPTCPGLLESPTERAIDPPGKMGSRSCDIEGRRTFVGPDRNLWRCDSLLTASIEVGGATSRVVGAASDQIGDRRRQIEARRSEVIQVRAPQSLGSRSSHEFDFGAQIRAPVMEAWPF